jgi:transcriptional regulator with PAS, ATPase and Fis domain
MNQVLNLVRKVSRVDSPVFLTGESGVGKGVYAQYIHNLSRHKDSPFIQVNCAAIPETLFEAEVFGYEPGSFTGASKQGKKGLMELVNDGTLFLDEIAELTPNLQAKLLQVLQEGMFWRVGGSQPIQLKARVLSATNQNVGQLLREKRFREDLYYRLCVILVFIPALREHWEDILPLAEMFLTQFNSTYGVNKYFSPGVRTWMYQYPWPGNVRELRNVVERLAVVSEGEEILPGDIPRILRKQTESWDMLAGSRVSLRDANEKMERAMIENALHGAKNTREAAATLGISQSTFLRKVHKYHLQIGESEQNEM